MVGKHAAYLIACLVTVLLGGKPQLADEVGLCGELFAIECHSGHDVGVRSAGIVFAGVIFILDIVEQEFHVGAADAALECLLVDILHGIVKAGIVLLALFHVGA